jgi:transcriptional regulator with XRE-family HTH domain
MDDGQFGRSLRQQRQTAGMTQRELAARAGVSVRALRYWENGKINTPRMASRQQIQRVLDGAPAHSPDRVRIGVLGALTIQGRSRELGLLRPKAAALLAVLALQPNQEIGRDEVIRTLWGDTPPVSYPRLLRGHADAVRRLLGRTPWLASVAKSAGYVLNWTSEPWPGALRRPMTRATWLARTSCTRRASTAGAARRWSASTPGCGTIPPPSRWPISA